MQREVIANVDRAKRDQTHEERPTKNRASHLTAFRNSSLARWICGGFQQAREGGGPEPDLKGTSLAAGYKTSIDMLWCSCKISVCLLFLPAGLGVPAL